MELENKVDPLFWGVVLSSVLSGFFALTSYSLRAHRRAQLEEAFAGRRGRKCLQTLERHLTALRLTISLCRMLANLILVVGLFCLYGAPGGGFLPSFAAGATAVGIIAVLGIAIPHAWASYAGEKVLAVTLGVLILLRYALYPITTAMQAFDIPVRRLCGVRDEENNNGDLAKQEIIQAASEGQAEGAVDADEVEMIESVMEFGDKQAGEIMTPRTDIFALPADTSWADARRAVFEAGHSRVPVYKGDLDNIIGILYAKDLLRRAEQDDAGSLRNIMRKCFFVPETKLLDDLLRDFKAGKMHIAVLLDEYGGTAGLVTIEDVLEEIVGDISDEYDRPEPALMKRVNETAAEVDGRMHIDEVNQAMNLHIPEDADYDTLAGFVFSELGYIPSAGEKLRAHAAEFTVLAADERRITRLRVERLDKRK